MPTSIFSFWINYLYKTRGAAGDLPEPNGVFMHFLYTLFIYFFESLCLANVLLTYCASKFNTLYYLVHVCGVCVHMKFLGLSAMAGVMG